MIRALEKGDRVFRPTSVAGFAGSIWLRLFPRLASLARGLPAIAIFDGCSVSFPACVGLYADRLFERLASLVAYAFRLRPPWEPGREFHSKHAKLMNDRLKENIR